MEEATCNMMPKNKVEKLAKKRLCVSQIAEALVNVCKGCRQLYAVDRIQTSGGLNVE